MPSSTHTQNCIPLMARAALHGLLALVFMLAQHTASLHWLSHSIEAAEAAYAAHGKAQASQADHCDECLLLSALGAAAANTHDIAAADNGARHALLAVLPIVASPAVPRLAFRSRAPPILI